MIERFTDKDPEVGASVIQAAALALRERGMPLWVGVDLSPVSLCSRDGDTIITGFIGDTAVAAMMFSDWDPEFWPESPKGSSTFVHKLAVLPSFQKQGLGLEMLAHAATLSRANGIPYTRLDCAADRPKLCAVDESAVYVKVSERVVGAFPTAFFEKKLAALSRQNMR